MDEKKQQTVYMQLGLVSVLKMELSSLKDDLLEVLTVLYNEELHEKLRNLRSLQQLVDDFFSELTYFRKNITDIRNNKVYLVSMHLTFELKLIDTKELLDVITNFKRKESIDYEKLKQIISTGTQRFEDILEQVNLLGKSIKQKEIKL